MKKAGFTLIELLVVIAIIGVLSSVVFMSVSDTRTRSRDVARIYEIRQIYNAIMLYQNTYGTLPKCSDGGYAGGCDLTGYAEYIGNADTSRDSVFLEFLVSAGFLSRTPVDPVNDEGHFYFYAANATFPPSSGDVYNFIFGGILESSNHEVLESDINTMPEFESAYVIGEVN